MRCDDTAEALLQPVRALVDGVLADWGVGADFHVTVGGSPGWVDGGVVLPSELAKGDPFPTGQGPGQVDRWRRAASGVLEGAVLDGLAQRVGAWPADDWRWVGLAAEVADRAAPVLGAAAADLQRAIATGNLHAHPRAGLAFWRWLRTMGEDPVERFVEVARGSLVSGDEWTRFGGWLFDAAPRLLEWPVERPPVATMPSTWGPWQLGRAVVAAGPGGRISTAGAGCCSSKWWRAGTVVVVGATDGEGTVEAAPAGVGGRWQVASASVAGQVMGARGVLWTLWEDGRLEIVLSDAFVGPLAALPVASEVGTSGVATGRWRVDEADVLTFEGVTTAGLTVHGRRGDRMGGRALGFGIPEWIADLNEGPWRFVKADDRLVMRGAMRGAPVEVRFRDADPVAD